MSLNNQNIELGIIEKQIEALLFVSPEPVSVSEMSSYLGVSTTKVQESICLIKTELEKKHAFTLLNIANGWQIATLPALSSLIEDFVSTIVVDKVRLSKAALETLSVIAYNQPVTRSEIEEIRSVRCDRVVDTLLKHGLVRIAGRKKSVGSPLLFRTTDRFLEIFGLSSISALPTLDELRDTPQDLINEATYIDGIESEINEG